MNTFEERAAYVRCLLEAVGATQTDAQVRELVRIWGLSGFSRMVERVKALRQK